MIVYLDVNHLSRLARSPNDPTCVEFLNLLVGTRSQIGLSFFHIHEISNPKFVSRPTVGALLDKLPVLWAPFLDEVFDREIEWAFDYALTDQIVVRTVFNRSFLHVFGAPENADIPVSQMIEETSMAPELRTFIIDAAEHGRKLDETMKRQAAAIRDPNLPILERIRREPLTRTRGGLDLVVPYQPEELLHRVGGLEAFPSYCISQGLTVLRLNDERYKTERNDLLDEWHACYTPYVDLMLLDKKTVARYRNAKLPYQDRVYSRLEDAVQQMRARTA